MVSVARCKMRITRPSGPRTRPRRCSMPSFTMRATTLSPFIAVAVFDAVTNKSATPRFSLRMCASPLWWIWMTPVSRSAVSGRM